MEIAISFTNLFWEIFAIHDIPMALYSTSLAFVVNIVNKYDAIIGA